MEINRMCGSKWNFPVLVPPQQMVCHYDTPNAIEVKKRDSCQNAGNERMIHQKDPDERKETNVSQ